MLIKRFENFDLNTEEKLELLAREVFIDIIDENSNDELVPVTIDYNPGTTKSKFMNLLPHIYIRGHVSIIESIPYLIEIDKIYQNEREILEREGENLEAENINVSVDKLLRVDTIKQFVLLSEMELESCSLYFGGAEFEIELVLK
jgi:hypothetical protein